MIENPEEEFEDKKILDPHMSRSPKNVPTFVPCDK
jgi:hypothetical protein